MKYGTLFAYRTKEWTGDYVKYAKKAKDLGFDILEIGAGELIKMYDSQLSELTAAAKVLGLIITSNIGPPRNKDVASKDPSVRAAVGEDIKVWRDLSDGADAAQMDKNTAESLVFLKDAFEV